MHRIEASQLRTFGGALLMVVAALLPVGVPCAQELVVATGSAPFGTALTAPVVVFPDFGAAFANPPRSYVSPLDLPLLAAHSLTLVAADRALVSRMVIGKLMLLDTANATRLDSYLLPQPAPATFYDGFGTLAANPAKTHVLVVTKFDTLWVIPAPFDHTAAVTMLTLPSSSATAQTRAIAFDSVTGRAYIALRTGIAVVDPPYTSVAFTIPTSNGTASGPSGAIALSPDNSTLVATRGLVSSYGPELRIFHAPFSAASVPDVLTIAGSSLDGMTFTPDGSKVLVVQSVPFLAPPGLPRIYTVTAPFSATSTVETLLFESGGAHDGFEDIDISADGQLAALSGGSINGDALVVLKAPFTAAGFTFTTINLPRFNSPYTALGGRGAGTARFWSTAIPALPPQMWVDIEATSNGSAGGVNVTEGNIGTTTALVPVNLSGPSALTVTVDYTTVDGTAPGGATGANNDYIPVSGTLTFSPGETTRNIVVTMNGDTKYEASEQFKVVISNPVNATLLGALPNFADTATVIIVNDDATVPATITTVALPDGAAGTPYSFPLTGTGADPLTWTSTNGGPNPFPFGLSIDPATGIISGIPVLPGSYTAFINLTDGVGNGAFKSLPFTIAGSGQPVVNLFPNPLDFGSRTVGSTSSIVTVVVANNGFGPLVLGTPFVTMPPGSDFALASGPIPCTDGLTVAQATTCSLYFTFTPQAAGTRSLTLNLAHNAAATPLTLTGVGTGGGGLPVVSIANAAAIPEGNSGTAPMTFAVTLAPVSAGTVTVNYAATGGTATSGVDYTVAGTGTLNFAPGVTTQIITVNVNGDTQVEPDETIVMTLAAPSGATLGTATASGTILNDDVAAPVLALLSVAPGFGNQVLATTSAPRTVVIGNAGIGGLVLATPFAPLAAGDFSYMSGANLCVAGQTLAPATNCNLYVVFTPSALGPRTTSIVLSSNAPDVVLVLTGTGITAAAPSPSQPIPTLSQWAQALLVLLMISIVIVRRRRQPGTAR